MRKNKGTLAALFILFLAVFGIVLTNYHPHTLLTGWDDLHSEFNLLGNTLRSLNSVWQEYETLGTFVGVSDAADLPRLLFLWLLSVIFSPENIRYAFHFLMLFAGVVGTYFAIKTIFIRESKYKNIASILGALFYLLNLGTLQYFTVPFEPFSSYWAIFPWLIFGTFRYIQNPTRKNLVIFALINFLATPAFFLQTIFYVYLAILLFLLTVYFITEQTKTRLKTVVFAFLIFLSVNAFWFLPHAYWFVTSRGVQQAASMNTLTTDETFQRVQMFGNLTDFMLFKNKPWDYRDFTIDNEQFLLQAWHDHLSNPVIPIIGYIVFLIALAGLITNKSYRGFSLGLAIICFIILANQAPVAEQINALFRKIPLINQALRDPFTKFIVPTIFIFSVGFSGGIVLLYRLLRLKNAKPLAVSGGILIGVLLLIYAFPIYSGHLFSDRMRVATPQYYFDFFSFMQKQDQAKRVANLPQGPIWGWTNYNWGYTGSGFLWHGMNNSIVDRTFDVWNEKSEEYYWELIYALNKRDYDLFHSVLKKYDVSYVMFDSAVYFPDNPNSAFGALRQKEFIDADSTLKKVGTFGSIDLFEVEKRSKKYISVITNPVSVTTYSNWLGEDKTYSDYGDYIVDKDPTVVYPFRSLFSGRGTRDVMYHITASPSAFVLQQKVPSGMLIFPEISQEEFTSFDPKDLKPTQHIPQVVSNGRTIASDSAIESGNIEVAITKDNRYGSYDSDLRLDAPLGIESPCETGEQSKDKKWSQVMEKNEKQYVRLSSTNARTCRAIPLSEVSQRNGYLVAVESRNRKGNPLHFWVENMTEKRSDQQIILKKQSSFGWEYFIIPPMATDGIGYALHFDNVSIGKQESVNDLSHVIVYPIPYRFLTELKIIQENPIASSLQNENIDSVDHPGSFLYTVSLQNVGEKSVFALYQSYNPGWKAYVGGIFGKELKEHVMVNNWANGWKVEGNPQKIVIIFWPQILQYIGFVLLFVPFVYAFWPRKKKHSKENF